MALNLSGDGDSGRLAAWGTLAVAAAAASFCAVERPRGMGLGARVAFLGQSARLYYSITMFTGIISE